MNNFAAERSRWTVQMKLLNSSDEPEYSDNLCLFLTFSNGFPLTERQVFAFFTSLYGPCVTMVHVHKPKPVGRMARPSLFGKVVFNNPLIPNLVMGPFEKVFCSVNGRPMYCSRFVTKTPSVASYGGHDQ